MRGEGQLEVADSTTGYRLAGLESTADFKNQITSNTIGFQVRRTNHYTSPIVANRIFDLKKMESRVKLSD